MSAPAGYLHVVAAAVFGDDGRLLLSRRHAHAHQGGLWEFPGGKVEAGESSQAALARELAEELGISPLASRRLIQIAHDYPDKRVWLDVWRVDGFSGEAHGREGQALGWFDLADLPRLAMPAANLPICEALRLPQLIAVTPPVLPPLGELLARASELLEQGVGVIHLRAPGLDTAALAQVATAVARLCDDRGAICSVALPVDRFMAAGAQCLHLPSRQLMRLRERPVPPPGLVSAACHTIEELEQAMRLGANFALLSPVAATATHPDANSLGWDGFAELARHSRMPVYALGGMGPDDLARAHACGGQGIAAIRAFWG